MTRFVHFIEAWSGKTYFINADAVSFVRAAEPNSDGQPVTHIEAFGANYASVDVIGDLSAVMEKLKGGQP